MEPVRRFWHAQSILAWRGKRREGCQATVLQKYAAYPSASRHAFDPLACRRNGGWRFAVRGRQEKFEETSGAAADRLPVAPQGLRKVGLAMLLKKAYDRFNVPVRLDVGLELQFEATARHNAMSQENALWF